MSIEKVAVVGAGQMGRGIAQVFATAGKSVIVVDINDAIIAAVESCLNDTPPQNTCACLRKPDGPCHHHQS